MKVLLDTNIIIHRESQNVSKSDIGILFKWLDNLHYTKCIHAITVDELKRYQDAKVQKAFNVKLESYNILKTEAPLHPIVAAVSKDIDKTPNDLNDTRLLNEVFNNRVDILITEDKKIALKSKLLNIANRVYSIDAFLEKVTAENPSLTDYKVLSVKKELFGNVNLFDSFFDTFREDYPDFDIWFNKKAEETAYLCRSGSDIMAFLYLKVEKESENYSDITPTFQSKRRLKIGTFKVTLNGLKLGERFLKIAFDNAVRQKVAEIYVTIFDKRIDQLRLINLLEEYGFKFHGFKNNLKDEQERVYVRDFSKEVNLANPKITYPYISSSSRTFIVPIYPEYHTNLFPDSILKTESPKDYVENEPFRNAISKVYISRSFERGLKSGDNIIFYRTGGYYEGVVSTIGVVENVITDIKDEREFILLCKKRSVFSDDELLKHWYYRTSRPFIVEFLYTYSLPKRINLKKLIELGIIADISSVPRGFTHISRSKFELILKEAHSDEGIIVD